MIIALRSAIICNKIEEKGAGADYLGIYGATLLVDSQPGFLQFYLAIQLELDRKPTSGFIRVTAADYNHAFPLAVPKGHWLPAIAFQLILPVLSAGPLMVSIHDAEGRGKPIRLKWTIAFAENAKVLDESAGHDFIATSEEVAALVKTSMAPKTSVN